VVIYSKPCFLSEPPLNFLKPAASKGNNLVAFIAYQMMVVHRCTNGVSAAIIPSVKLTDEPQPVQYLKGTVNGYQTNIRMLFTDFLIYGARGEIV